MIRSPFDLRPIAIFALAATGCVDAAADPGAGFETGACIDGECLGGLECVADQCVLPGGADTQASDGVTSTATGVGPGTTTTEPSTGSVDPSADGTGPSATTTGVEPTTSGGDSSTGGPPGGCNPPCGQDQECIAGVCIDVDPTTGGTAECGTNVSTGVAACDACSQDNCCPSLQACFGDETVMSNTPCLDLNNCIATSCSNVADLMGLEDCVDMACPALAGELNTWLALNSCVFMNCQADCT